MSDEQVVIYRAGRPHQAELLANLLGENGIEAVVHNDALQGALGEVPYGWATSVRVVVRRPDAERAREIALQFDQQLFNSADVVPADPAGAETLFVDVDTVECCPSCGRARLTMCPFCKTSSANFPGSTGPDRRGDQRIVVCSMCDEPFKPVYLKVCEWCGHEFADGTAAPAPAKPTEPLELNERMLFVIVGLVAVVGAMIGYFAWVLR